MLIKTHALYSLYFEVLSFVLHVPLGKVSVLNEEMKYKTGMCLAMCLA